MDRCLWEIEWEVVTDYYIMNDTEIISAVDEFEAVGKFVQIPDIPDEARIVRIECDRDERLYA